MSFGKGDVVELVSVDPNDVSCMKMKKIINNKEFSMPISHLKKVSFNKRNKITMISSLFIFVHTVV